MWSEFNTRSGRGRDERGSQDVGSDCIVVGNSIPDTQNRRPMRKGNKKSYQATLLTLFINLPMIGQHKTNQ